MQKVVDRTFDQYQAYWAKQVFTGRGVTPMTIADEPLVISTVISNKNAIAFVAVENVTDEVKVLTVL